MSDPQEAATPSDPHSAEAPVWRDAWRTFQDPYLGPDTEKFPSPFESFVAGYIAAVRSRDAEVAELRAEKERWHDAALIGLAQESAARSEVAELKAKIAGLEVWPAHDHVWDFNGRCLGCASWEKCPEFGSASSPVEGHDSTCDGLEGCPNPAAHSVEGGN